MRQSRRLVDSGEGQPLRVGPRGNCEAHQGLCQGSHGQSEGDAKTQAEPLRWRPATRSVSSSRMSLCRRARDGHRR